MEIIFYFIINIVFSIIIIFTGHQLWNYIKDTYSTKKTKDLVNTQIQKYKKIMKDIQNNDDNSNVFLNNNEKKIMDKCLTEYIENI